jgi:hypothetical protein
MRISSTTGALGANSMSVTPSTPALGGEGLPSLWLAGHFCASQPAPPPPASSWATLPALPSPASTSGRAALSAPARPASSSASAWAAVAAPLWLASFSPSYARACWADRVPRATASRSFATSASRAGSPPVGGCGAKCGVACAPVLRALFGARQAAVTPGL